MTEHDTEESGAEGRGVSRRSVLGGLMAALVAPALLAKAWARPGGDGAGAGRAVNVWTGRAVWTSRTACAPLPRFGHSATALADGRILVAGGWRYGGTSPLNPPLAGAQIYDPARDAWAAASPLLRPRAEHAAAALPDGRVLVTGGLGHAPLSDAEVYDPTADTWTRVSPMGQPRYGHAAAVSGGRVIITGGFSGQPQSGVLAYDIGGDVWQPAR